MAMVLITAPAALPVTLAEAKAHLRVETPDEDDYITGLLAAATAHVEGATGKRLILQQWRVFLDALPTDGPVDIPLGPLISVDAVRVRDEAGAPVAVDLSGVAADRHSDPPRLVFDEEPISGQALNGIEIDVTAGYGEAGVDVPDQLRRAVLVLAAHWHAFRGQASDDALFGTVPRGLAALLAPFRRARL